LVLEVWCHLVDAVQTASSWHWTQYEQEHLGLESFSSA